MNSITVHELAKWRNEGVSHTLIDIREPCEREVSHLDGAHSHGRGGGASKRNSGRHTRGHPLPLRRAFSRGDPRITWLRQRANWKAVSPHGSKSTPTQRGMNRLGPSQPGLCHGRCGLAAVAALAFIAGIYDPLLASLSAISGTGFQALKGQLIEVWNAVNGRFCWPSAQVSWWPLQHCFSTALAS